MNVQPFVEPTQEQLARIVTLEPRVRAIILEVVALSEQIIALKQAGLETREAAEALADVSDDVLDELRTLRISRGIQAFSDWWFQRVRVLWPLDDMVMDIPDDDTGGDAAMARRRHKAALAVDQAIATADPQLIELLDRASVRPLGPIDPRELQAAIGMTEVQLGDRAEIVLTQLIDSGWRP